MARLPIKKTRDPDPAVEHKSRIRTQDFALNISSSSGATPGSPFDYKNDAEIWEVFKRGDEAAFIYIYSKYFDELINYGIQFTPDVNLIEDCVQDLFIKLRNSRSKLGSIKKSIRLYLFVSLKRKLFNHKSLSGKIDVAIAESSVEFEIVLPQETHLIHNDVLTKRKKILEKAMKQLTRKQREAIYYVYYKNLSYREVTELMKIKTVKTLRNLLYRALGSMRSVAKHLL
ncbi:MAG: RNA polymerase sigma factor [Cytophagales bacterium]|nr:RNA polymerase sigma factor [Cytophagales bacterium]